MSQTNKNRVCIFTRVSTEKQDNERQLLELNNYCNQRGYVVTKTIATKITGSKTQKERPDLVELLSSAKKGMFTRVIAVEVSRLGRNSKDIRRTIDQLHSYGVSVIFKSLNLESLDENGQETFVTNIIISVYAELAQEEKRMLVERINSGLRSAKAKGKRLGRPIGVEDPKTTAKKYPGLVRALKTGMSIRTSMKLHEVSKGTVIKVKRLLMAGEI